MRNIWVNQRGSSHILVFLGILLIAVAGFASYRILNATEPEASSDTAMVSENKVPSKIDSSADVKKADKSLDSTDTSVNPDVLNDDIKSLQ